ncbi:hypothetical protein [Piscinibacter koreensis]|uniref:Uncharacterized protein n=1 Tax=Piscinibacter koreensis TaxID=2742824 RepID=A0A7Y6NME7_9BURK|nr:hypothetical protein [Schlegelella koreensis]NUZ05832.1 hypothetical protein [Schlegelella koreensis]
MSPRLLAPSAVLALACSAPLASASPPAQQKSIYAGTWNVALREAGRPERAARLTLGAKAATWVESGRASGACAGHRFPVTVLRSSPMQLDILVARDKLARQCPPLAIRVAPVDAKTLVGGIVDPDAAHGHDHAHAHGPDIHAGAMPVVELRMTRVGGGPGARR